MATLETPERRLQRQNYDMRLQLEARGQQAPPPIPDAATMEQLEELNTRLKQLLGASQ